MPHPLQLTQALSRLEDWQYDTFALLDASCGHPLSALGFYVLKRSGLLERFKVAGEEKLARWV